MVWWKVLVRHCFHVRKFCIVKNSWNVSKGVALIKILEYSSIIFLPCFPLYLLSSFIEYMSNQVYKYVQTCVLMGNESYSLVYLSFLFSEQLTSFRSEVFRAEHCENPAEGLPCTEPLYVSTCTVCLVFLFHSRVPGSCMLSFLAKKTMEKYKQKIDRRCLIFLFFFFSILFFQNHV